MTRPTTPYPGLLVTQNVTPSCHIEEYIYCKSSRPRTLSLHTGNPKDCAMAPTSNQMPVRSAAKEDPLEDIRRIGSIECGREALEHFIFAEGYRNLNHGMPLQRDLTNINPLGSYLTSPRRIRHVPQRDQNRPSPPPGSRRGKTRCLHSIRLPQTARRGSQSYCRYPQRPRRGLRFRSQRHYRNQHCPEESGLQPRRCHHLLRDGIWRL
jgi:hypothetical protein